METENVEINNIENKENEDQQIHTDNEAEVPSEESETEDDEATSNNTSNIYDDGIEITFQDDILDDEKDENPNESFEDDALVDQQIIDTVEATEEDYEFQNIKGHHWNDGVLMFTVQLTSGKTCDVPFALLKKDRPIETAKHIKYEVVESNRGGRYGQWAKKVLKRAQRVIRRMQNHHNIARTLRLDSYKQMKIRRLSKNQRNLKKKDRVKFGIEVPNNVRHALLLDKKNGNNAWGEAILKEMTALTKPECGSLNHHTIS